MGEAITWQGLPLLQATVTRSTVRCSVCAHLVSLAACVCGSVCFYQHLSPMHLMYPDLTGSHCKELHF